MSMMESTEFIPANGIQWQGPHVGTVQYGGGDKNMLVMFYKRAIHNPQRSQAEGRPFYDEKIFVKMQQPGERLNIIDREVTDSDKKRFSQQWGAFVQNREQVPDGTPIEMLYPEMPAISAGLRGNGVHTIEQCAELTGHAIDTIGVGAQRYSNDAKQYLLIAEKGAKGTALRAELDARDREINTLKHTCAMLQEQVERLVEASSKNLSMGEVKALIAQSSQTRPVYPEPSDERPHKSFDVQGAQIAANHATRTTKRVQPRQAAVAKPVRTAATSVKKSAPVRERARL